MLTLWLALTKRRNILGGSILEYIIVGVIFFILVLFYTDFVLLKGTHQLFIEGPGDGTAGFLWYNYANTGPFFGHTNLVNFPIGDNLQNPTQITYSAVMLPLWALSQLFGPTMGLNIVTFFGFWGAGMAMYWLMKKLVRSVPIALLSGFAAAFIPYQIIKSSSHLTYIFSLVFVLILGAFIGLWRKPSWKRALLFAATIALAYYTDGYYLLIGTIFVACLAIGALIFELVSRTNKKIILTQVKHFFVAIGFLLIMILPILFVESTQGAQVKSVLTNARGNISSELEAYATNPVDYFLPSSNNPFIRDNPVFQKLVTYKNGHSNASENTTYIGYTLLFLSIIGFIIAGVYLFDRRRSSLKGYIYRNQFLFVITLGAVSIPILMIWMMKPHLNVFGLHLIMPSGVLLHFGVALWRVMARFYIPLHVIFTVVAGMSLSILINTSKIRLKAPRKRLIYEIIIVLVLTSIIAIEYATLTSRPPYDFNNLPKAYSWIRDKKDIKVIAEMPMLDRPLEINYNFVTAQLIHGKALINTAVPSHEIGGRNALGDINSQEAVDYAIARGADTIISHNKACYSPSWGDLVYKDLNESKSKEAVYYGSPICVYKVKPGIKVDPMFAKLQTGTFADVPYVNERTGEEYSVIFGDLGIITIADDVGGATKGLATIDAKILTSPNAPKFIGIWKVTQGDVVIGSGEVYGQIHLIVDASKPIYIKVLGLNGNIPQNYQVSLENIVVTATNTP